MKRYVAFVLFFVLTVLCCTTAFAELSGSSTVGPVTTSGTFDVVATGSSTATRATLRVTSYNASANLNIAIRVFKGNLCVYDGGILSGNSYLDCSLPGFSSKGTYTIEYIMSGSTYLKAEFNP